MAEIVLDKSYLDGASAAEVTELCDRYTVFMPQELFFEMMTTCPTSQRRCFSKLPDRDSPVALIPPVGVLVDFERRNHQPCILAALFGAPHDRWAIRLGPLLTAGNNW